MKKILFSLALAAMASSLYAQVPLGTVCVNNNFTATLNFPDSVKLTIFGNNPSVGNGHYKYFDVFQSGNTCIIRGNDPTAPAMTLNVLLVNGVTYYGTIKYSDSTKIFYNYTEEKKKQEIETLVKKAATVQGKEATLKERMNSVLSDPAEYNSIGAIENNISFKVANIKNDDNYTYYKIVVENQTGSDYNIDGVYFKIVEGKRKGLKKNEAKIELPIRVEFESPTKVVAAYSTVELGYVTERFTGSKNCVLVIQFRELNGTRNPRIEIPGEKMLKTQVFENKL